MPGKHPVIVILFSAFCLSCLKQEQARKEFTFFHDGGDTLAIYMKNHGPDPAEFSLKFNGFFPASLDDMSDTIQKIPNGPGRETVVRKAWFFVYSASIQSSPLTSGEWYHSPELILNSTGFGLCDDRATILAQLWRYLGFQSRLVSLTGHVVPEVNENGKWQMYDPHFGIFFPGPDGLATNVQELASCSELFNNYFSIDSARALFFRIRKEEYIKKIISTGDNSEQPVSITGNEDVDFSWLLPPGAELIFPGRFSGEILEGYAKPIYRHSQVKVILSPSQSQEIKIPLVLYAINGNGSVNIHEKKFTAGSGEFYNEIRKNGCFNEKIKISNPDDTMTMLFFINPLLSRLHVSNRVVTKGYGLAGVSAGWKWIPEGERVKYYLEDTIAGFLEKNQKAIQQIDSIKKCLPQNDSNLFINLAERYVILIPGLNDQEKKEKTRILKERYSFFQGMIHNTKAYEEFRHILNIPAVVLVAIKILETSTPEEIKREFSKYALLIENYKPPN